MAAMRDSSSNANIAYSQNFLRNPKLVERLLDCSGIAADDLVIEIGPGRGALTAPLAARCRQVLAVEKDPKMVAELRLRFAEAGNIALFAADFLSFPLPLTTYKVFANIPFNVTAAIVGKLTSGSSPPVDAHLAMQREAAERFLGQPKQTLVAVLLHPWFAPSIVHRFRASDFSPTPGVEVVLLRLQRRPEAELGTLDAALYADLVTYAYTAWKPTVRQALAGSLPTRRLASLERASGVALDRPPTALSAVEWVTLTRAWRDVLGEPPAALRGARDRLDAQQAGLQKQHRTRVAGDWQRDARGRG